VDVSRFHQYLPAFYTDWERPTVRPQSNQFSGVLQRVRGMTTPCVLQLLNFAVACLEKDEIYAEVGCYHGATLIGALLNHPTANALAADNFSQFDPSGQNRQALFTNLEAFGLSKQVHFHDQDAEDFLAGLRTSSQRLGVYFYDGAHDYRSQLMGLLLAVPVLAPHALIIVDDGNVAGARQAVLDFLATYPQARLLFDIPTPCNCHPTFWNGLLVIDWDAQRTEGTSREALRKDRQAALLESIDVLQRVKLTLEGSRIQITPIQ
jgi:protein O-GlcNAc transferase